MNCEHCFNLWWSETGFDKVCPRCGKPPHEEVMTKYCSDKILYAEEAERREWMFKSKEWRKGYNACNTGKEITQKEFDSQSYEWQQGYVYAIRNLMKPYYSIDATTGR